MNSGGEPGATGTGSAGARGVARGGVGVEDGLGAEAGDRTGEGDRRRARVRLRRGAVRRTAVPAAGFRCERARGGVGVCRGFAAAVTSARSGTRCGSIAKGAALTGRATSPAAGGRWSSCARASTSTAALTARAIAAADRRTADADAEPPGRRRTGQLRRRLGSRAPASIGASAGAARDGIGGACRRASPRLLTLQAPSGARNTLRGSCAGAAATGALAGSGIVVLQRGPGAATGPPCGGCIPVCVGQASCSATASPSRLTARRVVRPSASSAYVPLSSMVASWSSCGIVTAR